MYLQLSGLVYLIKIYKEGFFTFIGIWWKGGEGIGTLVILRLRSVALKDQQKISLAEDQ